MGYFYGDGEIEAMFGEAARNAHPDTQKAAGAMTRAIVDRWPEAVVDQTWIAMQLAAFLADGSQYIEVNVPTASWVLVAEVVFRPSHRERFERSENGVIEVEPWGESDETSMPGRWCVWVE